MLSKLAELLESIPSEQRESPRRLTKLRKIDGINLHESRPISAKTTSCSCSARRIAGA